jgi:hypothetical protein
VGEEPPLGGRKEGQIKKVTQYTNQQLEDILTEQGMDPTELRKQADEAARAQAPTLKEGDLPRGPEPTSADAGEIATPTFGEFTFHVLG